MSLEPVDVILANRRAEVAARPVVPDPLERAKAIDADRRAQLARRERPEPVAAEPADPVTDPVTFNPLESDLPSIRDLPDALADLDRATVEEMRAADGRKSAQAIYDRRLAEMEG